jgi:hypothetical protein
MSTLWGKCKMHSVGISLSLPNSKLPSPIFSWQQRQHRLKSSTYEKKTATNLATKLETLRKSSTYKIASWQHRLKSSTYAVSGMKLNEQTA